VARTAEQNAFDLVKFVRDLVNEVNAANSPEQLEGYFDYLAETYNPLLIDLDLGLPLFTVVGHRE
jgi:hypothetical protein